MKYLSLIILGIGSVLSAAEQTFYVGTLGAEAKGIWRGTIDTKTGKLSTPVLVAEVQECFLFSSSS
jgi:6-phosphogluconolactonase (cycloisomerase 2 family)